MCEKGAKVCNECHQALKKVLNHFAVCGNPDCKLNNNICQQCKNKLHKVIEVDENELADENCDFLNILEDAGGICINPVCGLYVGGNTIIKEN